MTSEIKVDTISEQTSANGVTIDGLTIKDGNIQGSPALVGTTPSFTIGDGGAEDTKIVFDGNALDYYIGLDDSADNLIIGSGSTVGSNSLITIDSDGDFTLDSAADITLDVGGGDISLKGSGAEYGKFNLSGNSLNIHSSISDGDIVFKGSDGGSAITALTLDMSAAGNATFNGTIIANAGVSVDNITIDGTEIDLSSGDLTLDVAGDIILDADGADVSFRDGGTGHLSISNSSNDAVITSLQSDNDMIFKGVDGGALITALTLDMSDAGTATFNHDIKLGNDQIAKFGAAANLQIYANSINSFITESGSSGNLKIQGQTIRLEKTTEEIMLRAVNDGQVELYYPNVIKVLTSSTGINLPVDGDSIKFGADSEVVLTHVHNAGLEISAAGNLDTLKLVSTDDDANVGPVLNYYRNSGNVADNDYIGRNLFTFNNDAPEVETALAQNVVITDASNGSEDVKYIQEQMTAGSIVERFTVSASEAVFNEGSVDVDFRVESDGNANMLKVDGGNNRVGVGCDPSADFHVDSSGGGVIRVSRNSSSTANFMALESDGTNGTVKAIQQLLFSAGGSERMRIDTSGVVLVGTTSADVGGNTAGIVLGNDGYGAFRRSGATVMYVNRFTDDGVLINLYGQGSIEGTIAVSGSTVSYNGFTGTHWSRLSDNSKPTILRGTVMESLDEMCDWYQAVAEVAESTDDEGNVTPAHTVKESIALGDKSVGDAITFTSNGTEYSGTIVKEDDVKHTKCKVSDTADSKKVYGVFSNWDDADDGLDGDVNDMNIAQVGTFIVRVNADVTVEAGDLLVSNGDGTAKKQDDDIIRSKTVAKVNSNIKVETYSDGSYTVPCTLHC
jgi:hypothetical protein